MHLVGYLYEISTSVWFGENMEAELYIHGAELNVKLWPRFKKHWWPSYGVITIYNITRICRFRKSVATSGQFTRVANFTDITVFY